MKQTNDMFGSKYRPDFGAMRLEELWEEESFYSQMGRRQLLEQDALSSEEDAFMQGYEDAWDLVQDQSEEGQV